MNPDGFSIHLPTIPVAGEPELCFRWLQESDLDALRAIFSKPEVVRYMSCELQDSDEKAREYLLSIHQGFLSGELYQWGLEWRGNIVGTATLAGLERHAGGIHQGEIGFALAPACWGQGLMRRVLPTLLDFAFSSLGLHRLTADVDPRNRASLSLLEFLGFQREGLMRQRYFHLGEIQDAMIFGLLRQEWQTACR
ncbi:GNAT family N-acetyltransferase [Microbulbifer sp. ALW1]|uniref:GNAT family N-acetyltransferase n=1 Tax=Microbulbifer sp. (strain ALW1) TaxID=1516059 RepID=UPI00135A360B|nr:GNAT family protein [Microbulbifer sp. ALW1]